MHKLLLVVSLAVCSLLFSSMAISAPISVVDHSYGRNAYNPSSPDTCGNIFLTHLRVSGTCSGYVDLFSLANFNVAAIDYLELTLGYSNTASCNQLNGNCPSGIWQLDVLNASGSKLGTFDLQKTGTAVQQRFVLNRLNMPAFDDLFSQGALWFGFTRTGAATNAFNLSSSQLAVFAMPAQEPTPVPAPATLALFGLSLVAMCLRRRTQQ